MLEKNDRTLFSHNLITCFSAFFIRKMTHPGEQSSAITLQSFTVSYFDSEHSIQTYLLQITVCYTHRRRMETENKAKCRRFGLGGKIECHTGNLWCDCVALCT